MVCIVRGDYSNASRIRNFQGARKEIIQLNNCLFKAFMLLGVRELTSL